MTTDESYMNFLDKADHRDDDSDDTNIRFELKCLDDGIDVSTALKEAADLTYYISDADEPFVPVSLRVSDGFPNEECFARLVNHPDPLNAIVSIIDVDTWDHRGDYKELVDAVSQIVDNSPLHVYRISLWGSRAEYWLVGLGEGKTLVGVKALAIED
ncbi:hypothetical protein K3495_g6287 [Podosphaera aphanis]|nr:hypothetical protein K3495_g6287 [Podosphaera aphanis]